MKRLFFIFLVILATTNFAQQAIANENFNDLNECKSTTNQLIDVVMECELFYSSELDTLLQDEGLYNKINDFNNRQILLFVLEQPMVACICKA